MDKKNNISAILNQGWPDSVFSETYRLRAIGYSKIAINYLGESLMKLMRPLMDDSELGGPKVTVSEFVRLRLEDANKSLKKGKLTRQQVKDIKAFWSAIEHILELYSQKNISEARLRASWNDKQIMDLAKDESEEFQYSTGYIVLISTLQRCFKSWVTDGVMDQTLNDWKSW